MVLKRRLRPPWALNPGKVFRNIRSSQVEYSEHLLALQGSTGTSTGTHLIHHTPLTTSYRLQDRDLARLSEEPAASETHFSYIYVHVASPPESIIFVTVSDQPPRQTTSRDKCILVTLYLNGNKINVFYVFKRVFKTLLSQAESPNPPRTTSEGSWVASVSDEDSTEEAGNESSECEGMT